MATGNTLYGAVAAREYVGPTASFATPDTRNGYPCLDFDDTTDESADFTFLCPSALASGGGVTVKLGWGATSATSGDVIWNISFLPVHDDTVDVDTASFGSALAITATTASASGELSYDTVAFTSAIHGFLAAGEFCKMRVTRNADDAADTLVGDAELYTVEVYQT